MSDFMVPEWEEMDVYLVETSIGIEMVPVDVSGVVESADDLRDYLEGEPVEGQTLLADTKWIGRLSAPGYMDAIDWTWADSEELVLRDLLETQGDVDGDEWPNDVRKRLVEINAGLRQFVDAYVECALWSSTYETPDRPDMPFDETHGAEDLSDECRASMLADCVDFWFANQADLSEQTPEQSGHDFWLTRNGHGAGFWDRGLGKTGERLTAAAKVYGSCYLYLGEDGRVYVS